MEGAACGEHDGEVHNTGVIVHDMKADMENTEIQTENLSDNTHHTDNVLTAGPIAGIVVGVVALVAVLGMIGYKVTRKPTTSVSDNSYTSM